MEAFGRSSQPRPGAIEQFIVAIVSEACFDTTTEPPEYFDRTAWRWPTRALVPAGLSGSIDVFVLNTSHVVTDTNGYFGQ